MTKTHAIKIFGLGPSDLDHLPLGIYRRIIDQGKIYVRTQDHPVVNELRESGVTIESFDWVYDLYPDSFDQVYDRICQEVLKLALDKEVLYGVPGHPRVGEQTTVLLEAASDQVQVLGGQSFIDDLFNAVGVDPVEGFQLVDALAVQADDLVTKQHLIVMQVFSSLVAGDLKLTLMDQYPDEHPVYLVDAAGDKNQAVYRLPLAKIDHFEGVHNLRTLYVPPLDRDDRSRSFATLLSYTDEIMGPGGDAWIKEKSSKDLIPYLKEETAELVAAIEAENDDNIVEELGDLLMQVVYQAKLGEQESYFSIEDVLEGINKKLRRRHPHVFDGVKADSPKEVNEIWQAIKAKEKEEQNERKEWAYAVG